jgi:hypothetical protein
VTRCCCTAWSPRCHPRSYGRAASRCTSEGGEEGHGGPAAWDRRGGGGWEGSGGAQVRGLQWESLQTSADADFIGRKVPTGLHTVSRCTGEGLLNTHDITLAMQNGVKAGFISYLRGSSGGGDQRQGGSIAAWRSLGLTGCFRFRESWLSLVKPQATSHPM